MNVVEPSANRNAKLVSAVASGVALLVLGAGGHVAYLHAGALFASTRTLPPVLLLASALIGGAASFFSPCSIAITPAFLTYLVSGTLPGDRALLPRARLRWVAIDVAIGIVVFYAIAAVILGLIGNLVYNFLIYLLPLVGIVFVGLGALMFFGRAGWLSAAGRANPMNRLYEGYEKPAKNRGALSRWASASPTARRHTPARCQFSWASWWCHWWRAITPWRPHRYFSTGPRLRCWSS